MPFINIAKTLLETYNFFDHPGTRYEHWYIDEHFWVYMFANHFSHTNVKFKIDITNFIFDYFP